MELFKKDRKELDRKPLSDASKLIWHQYMGPINGAVVQLNAALENARNVIAHMLLKADGLDPEEWALDPATMKAVRRPREVDNAVGE